MAEWILGVSKAAALGWARGPGKRSECRSRQKAICPHAMRSFWKVAAFRQTESIRRILSARRALRCFQNELHHFYHFESEVVLRTTRRPSSPPISHPVSSLSVSSFPHPIPIAIGFAIAIETSRLSVTDLKRTLSIASSNPCRPGTETKAIFIQQETPPTNWQRIDSDSE